MVNEVESILNEIRERVRNDQEPGSAPVAISDETANDSLALTNAESVVGNSESLSRLSAHLTTTSRAWDRLPPLYSNRRGGAARLELWIKARLKSMSRWFTWEQVNFNSAVHHALSETLHALSETLHALSASQQGLAGLRAELRKETESWREKFESSDRELSGLRAGIETLTAEIRKRDANQEARSTAVEARSAVIEARSAAIEARSAAIEARSAAIEARAAELAAVMWKEMEETRVEITSRLAELAGELRESDQELRDEHRVCFKQLSLEASEAAVMEDRGRRVFESRLDKLEKAVSTGEK